MSLGCVLQYDKYQHQVTSAALLSAVHHRGVTKADSPSANTDRKECLDL